MVQMIVAFLPLLLNLIVWQKIKIRDTSIISSYPPRLTISLIDVADHDDIHPGLCSSRRNRQEIGTE